VVKQGPLSETFSNKGKSKFSHGNSTYSKGVLSINYEDLEIDHNAESVYYAKTGISSVIRETLKTD
jgi:hypothetical protein